jgi:hypothetical protein
MTTLKQKQATAKQRFGCVFKTGFKRPFGAAEAVLLQNQPAPPTKIALTLLYRGSLGEYATTK